MLKTANIASVIVKARAAEVVVMAHNRKPLGDDEWRRNYLAHVSELKARADLETAANLVFAEGQGPNAQQRSAGNAIFGKEEGYRFKVAVVTESIWVRGAVTALRWFNPLISAYPPQQWRSAFSHVRFQEADHEAVFAALRKLQSAVEDVGVLDQVVAHLESAR